MHHSSFDFYFNTRTAFGAGERRRLADILAGHAWRRIGVVVDHHLLPLPIIRRMIDDLRLVCEKAIVSSCAISEPTYDALEEARPQFMNQDLQAIIGIGGGSALDMAKAMAVLVNNKLPAIQYRGFDRMTEPVLPIIAIPTTAGTGSEITPNASFIDAREQRKMGINGEAIRPRYAILDPELTLSCPARPTVSAGVDSLVHAVEAYVAKRTNPLARLFAKEGFEKVFNNLPAVIREPQNIELRAEVQYGAFLSAVALMNSGTGPAAAMSYPLGVHYQVPHGIGGALFLPHVVQHNLRHGCYAYGDLYDAIAGADLRLTVQEKARAFHQQLVEAWAKLEVPASLTATGFEKSFTDIFVAEAMQLKAALEQNPAPFGENEIRRLLNELSA
jgi:alcohol dehydrogenase class IV